MDHPREVPSEEAVLEMLKTVIGGGTNLEKKRRIRMYCRRQISDWTQSLCQYCKEDPVSNEPSR